MPDYDPAAIESRWQSAWARQRPFEPEAVEGRPKYMIIFAYPGISGYLHVGHMRGYTYCDAIARYHRHLGEDVLFPAGFHASGIPAVSYARKVERGDPSTLETLRAEGADEETIARLKDPEFVVSYFRKVYEERYWRAFGFSIDYSRLACTTDPGYQRFIQWQFRRLHDAGLLVQKPHFAPFCPASGPVAVDASETDVSRGGDAEVVAFTALRFRDGDGLVYPCATLRPETVYGVTNVWVNPSATYTIAEVGGERWLLSEAARVKAQYLFEGGAKEVDRVEGRALVGRTVKAPVTGADVPVLPSSFVDPRVGTGVVMSVPAHAPYDFQALADLKASPGDVRAEALAGAVPIVMVGTGGQAASTPSPAEAAAKAHGVRSVADRAALDAATEEVYAKEFREGRMLENTGPYAGMPVAAAREKLIAAAEAAGDAAPFQEFSKEVVCRCGERVLIKRIPDQWFIHYSDEELTRTSADHARTMAITPAEVARDMPGILEWFGDRACIRQGAWLGSRFPLDEKWVIEPISDSTLYPAYYTVSGMVNAGDIEEGSLSDAFFDYAFLGRGSPEALPGVSPEAAKEARRQFLHWYPLDVNLGGKEHKTVHFPAFIKTHLALLPKELWPKGVFVNWWVTMGQGSKLSKSKGGAEPVVDLVAKFGVDALRLYYCHAAAPWLDVEWDPSGVLDYRARLGRIHDTVKAVAAGDLVALGAPEGLPPAPTLDRWLESALERRLSESREGWRQLDFRQVSTPVFFGMLGDLRWYVRRGGRNLDTLGAFARAWVVAMAPIAPHLAEELHASLGGEGLVSVARAGEPAPAQRDAAADFVEEYLQSVLADTQRIRQVAEGFQAERAVSSLVQGLAGSTVRGELVGAERPLVVPVDVKANEKVENTQVDVLFGHGAASVAVEIRGRPLTTTDAVEVLQALVADGAAGAGWIVAAAGASPTVREAAKEAGLLFSGPAELELLAAEHNLPPAKVQPRRVTLISAPHWTLGAYTRTIADTQEHGKPGMGRVLKALAADPAFKPHMSRAPQVVQVAVQDLSSRRPEEVQVRAKALVGFDEYAVLEAAVPFLAAEFACPVEVLTADNPESKDGKYQGKAEQAAPLRPGVVVDY